MGSSDSLSRDTVPLKLRSIEYRSTSIHVIQGSQIRRILLTLGFQLGLSSWHIAVRRLRIAYVQITSLQAANVRSLIFTANCHKSRLSHFLETALQCCGSGIRRFFTSGIRIRHAFIPDPTYSILYKGY
jgi:hypothetical protein